MADSVKDYDVGSHESLPERHSGESFGISVDCDITAHTDPSSTIVIEAYVSVDGGLTWEFAGSATCLGGVHKDMNGTVLTRAGFHTEHTMTGVLNGKLYTNVAKWTDPLIKTVLRVEGSPTKTAFGKIESKPRTQPMEETHRSIAVVQAVAAYGDGSVTSVTTGSVSTTTGNLLIANTSNYGGASAFVSVTSSPANTFSVSVAQIQTVGGLQLRQHYVENATGDAVQTFTHTGSGVSYFPGIIVLEVSGYDASPLDVSATDTDSSGTTHTTAATGTSAQANELLIGCGIGGTTFTETYTPTASGWTTQANTSNIPGRIGGICQSKVVTDGPTTYTWTYDSSASMESAHLISTWKEAAGGGGAMLRHPGMSGGMREMTGGMNA